MRLKILAALLFSLICIFPGSKAGFFNGLPFSSIEIYFSFFVFLAIFLTPWENIRIIKRLVFTSVALFLILQFFSYKFLPYGWSVCVYSNIGKVKLESKCEPTTEDPSGKTSYVYSKIDFTSKNIPLYFMNLVSFNFYEKGEPDRDLIPYTLEAQTYVYPQKNEKLIVRSERNVSIKINERELIYSNLNNLSEYNLIPGKTNHILLKYDSNRSKDNRLEAKLTNNNFYKNEFSSASAFLVSLYKALNAVIILILFFCFTFSFVSCFLSLEKRHRYILTTSGIILLAFYIITIAIKIRFKYFSLPFSIILFSASFYYLFSSQLTRKKIIPFLCLIFFLNSAILTTSHLKPEETIIFSGGGDELGHESFARSSFSVTSFDELLHSTEGNGAYYYQPLHRYFFAVLHKISGESMWGPYLIQTLAFSLAILFMLIVLKKTIGRLATSTFLIIYFLFFTDVKNSVLSLMQSPLQQGIPLILIILGISMILLFLFKKETRIRMFFLLGIIFGTSFMIRTDWIPIVAGIFVFCVCLFLPYFRSKRNFVGTVFLLLGLSIFPLFVGFRNWHVAQEFVILPSASNVNLSRDLLEASSKKIIMDKSSFSETLRTVASNFSGRYGQLAKIMAKNVRENMIGKKMLRKIIWYFLPVLVLLAAFITVRKKLYYLLSIEIFGALSFISLVILSSLFLQHNGIAMQGIYDLLSIFIFAVCIEIISYGIGRVSSFPSSKPDASS